MAFSFLDQGFQESVVKLERIIEDTIDNSNSYNELLAKNIKLVLGNFYKNSVGSINENTPVIRTYDGFNLGKFFREDPIFLENDQLSDMENVTLILEGANALLYLYFREYTFRKNFDPSFELAEFMKFINVHKAEFNNRISYIFSFYEEVPYKILRDLYQNNNVQTIINLSSENKLEQFIEFANKASEATQKIINWENNLNEQEGRATQLTQKFTDQIKQYNFLGLNNGFSNLKTEKITQLNANRFGFWIFSSSIFILLITEIFLILNDKILMNSVLIFAVPSITLFLFLFYFVRIHLQNINSIKSQILQIDLRMALCQFIHNYADQAKLLKNEQNKDGLEKFENIIFSPIVASDDKIPSTFDGVEQLAKLFSEFKGK